MKYWVMEPGMAPVMKYYTLFHSRWIKDEAFLHRGWIEYLPTIKRGDYSKDENLSSECGENIEVTCSECEFRSSL